MTALNAAGDLDTTSGCYGIDGPDTCHCHALPDEHTEDQCADLPCPTCRGFGGWQQQDGVIVERPRGCMTREDNR